MRIAKLHEIVLLTLLWFDRWLHPRLSRSRDHLVSPIQENDPYVEGLIRALGGGDRPPRGS